MTEEYNDINASGNTEEIDPGFTVNINIDFIIDFIRAFLYKIFRFFGI